MAKRKTRRARRQQRTLRARYPGLNDSEIANLRRRRDRLQQASRRTDLRVWVRLGLHNRGLIDVWVLGTTHLGFRRLDYVEALVKRGLPGVRAELLGCLEARVLAHDPTDVLLDAVRLDDLDAWEEVEVLDDEPEPVT